jgi:putative membrane-bound dehydrogenase-like protein
MRIQPQAAIPWILSLALLPRARAEDLGLTVPPEFRISVYADETIANDTYAMTLDAKGRVAITTQGAIKILHDDNSDGRADRATLFAETRTGGMGLCFDGSDLMFCGDGWLSRYRDADGDGRADGPPEKIMPMRFAEHGGHAMRLGPDGWWYVIGGNDTGYNRSHITGPRSPIRDPEGGAVVRLSPDFQTREMIAHGFRNPYDFDFNSAGQIFTYDSDVERDYFLPWYTPTRIYHAAFGGHHGWRLTGFMRSWCRRDYFVDTVDILASIGRGSPTGVTCYRHDRFPARYQDGVFALDWTFGKVYFLRLDPAGASYETKPEVFLEPTGSHGFDPTDVVVAPDGALLISIGGRRTRGSVYRVEYTGPLAPRKEKLTPVLKVLYAPQPVDAWSRADWVAEARRVGQGPFVAAVSDETLNPSARVRAVEILTELFGGLPDPEVRVNDSLARARVAWSLGRTGKAGAAKALATLARDDEARVRLAALDSWCEGVQSSDETQILGVVRANLGHPDKRVRQAAARLAAQMSQTAWRALWSDWDKTSQQMLLTAALAAAWRGGERDRVVDTALAVFKESSLQDLQLQALRLIVIALGDYNLEHPPVEIFTAYSLSQAVPSPLAARILEATRPRFPSGVDRLDHELARLLAMLEDDAPTSLRKVAAMWRETTSPTQDVHYLVTFARLRAEREPGMARRVGATLLGLDRKLQGQEQRIKQSWGDRLGELAATLAQRDPAVPEALLAHPEFARAPHVAIALALDSPHRREAARRFRDAAATDLEFEWSGALVTLLSALPAAEVRPLLRSQWENFALRDAILLQLASGPEPTDREKFIEGLDSGQPQVVATCLEALGTLSRDESAAHLVPILRLLRRLLLEPKEVALRARALGLFTRQSGAALRVEERTADTKALRAAYTPVFAWFREHHPELVSALDRDDTEDAAAWERLKASIDWTAGRAEPGEAIFRARACHTCHAGPGRLGPDLAGVAARFSRDDLWAEIVTPNREVAPPYRVTLVETRDGRILSGIVAFESADGLILQTGASETQRIATADIASRQPSSRSLMPTGLLKGLTPNEVADLFRYLEEYGKPPASAAQRAPRS